MCDHHLETRETNHDALQSDHVFEMEMLHDVFSHIVQMFLHRMLRGQMVLMDELIQHLAEMVFQNAEKVPNAALLAAFLFD